MAMTNFEYYKDEIQAARYDFAFVDGKVTECNAQCLKCEFGRWGNCPPNVIKWLYEEYTPPAPKLTKNERKLCEILQEGYIAKESNGVIAFYEKKPQKIKGMYWGALNAYSNTISDYMFADCGFSFITWDDPEPWSREDLLKLEVMDND